MEKVGLVLEGGGMRGVFTSGVLDCMMEHGLYLPNVYGVSAGACNGANYVSKQPGRSIQINSVHDGEQYDILDAQNGWYFIDISGKGAGGWVCADYVKEVA